MDFKQRLKFLKCKALDTIENVERGVVLPLIRLFDKVFNIERAIVRIDKQTLLKKRKYKELPIVGYRMRHMFTREERELMLVNGRKVSSFYKLKNGDIIQLTERPKGKLTASIVQIVAGITLLFVPGAQSIGVALIVSGVTSAISTILIGTPKAQDFEQDATQQRADIKGAKNTVSNSVVPCLLGRTKFTPYYGQQPYREVGDGSASNYYLQYFIPTFNNINISDEKLGETDTGDFSSRYFDKNISFGGASFIGYRNVKPVVREEQLSVDNSAEVSQTSTRLYNQASTSTTLEYEPIVQFDGVPVGSFSTKTFKLEIDVLDNTTPTALPVTLEHEFTVNEGDLTLVGGDVYNWLPTHTFTQNITEITETRFYPITQTRQNTAENDSSLEVEILTQEITTDDYNNVATLNQGLNKYTGIVSEVVETSPSNTEEVDFIFSFPQGLYKQNSDGSRSARSVNVSIEYKNGAGIYLPIDSLTLYVRDKDGVKQPLSGSSTVVNGDIVTFQPPTNINQADELFFRTIGAEMPSAGKYTFKVRSADLLEKSNFDIGVPYLSEFNFQVAGDVLDTSVLPNLIQVSIDATAYKDLSGELNEYNFIGASKLPIWNGVDWNTVAETRNPASVVRYIITSELINPRAESVDVIDNESFAEFYGFCEANGFKADVLITQEVRILDIIRSILGNCKAVFAFVNGQYKILIDDDTKPYKEMFTQHNSWGFINSTTVGEQTNAVRVGFVNEAEYNQDEFTLYYYDNDIYETPKVGTSDIDYKMIKRDVEFTTDRAHVKEAVSYDLRNVQEKRVVFTFKCNLESLTSNIYDRVYIADTTDLTDEVTGRIRSLILDGGNITGFKLKSKVDIPSGAKITVRSINYTTGEPVITVLDVLNSGYDNVVMVTPTPNTGNIRGEGEMQGLGDKTWHYDGDMFDIGIERIYECVILEVRYNEDLTATITAREA